MWIPKNPPGGLPVKMAAGVMSLVAVHLVFIGLHTLLDETSPMDTFVYPIDRTMEGVELQWSMLWGNDAEAEARSHFAHERIREIETLLVAVESGEYTREDATHIIQSLLSDALVMMDLAIASVQESAAAHPDDIHDFALAIFVESTVEDIVLRMMNVQSIIAERKALFELTDNFLITARTYLDVSTAIVATFHVPEGDQIIVREQVQQQFLGSVSIQPEADGSACVAEGRQCGTTSDCCGSTGLVCMPFQSSSGFTRRCQRIVHRICVTDCKEVNGSAAWGTPHGCEAGYIENDIPPCSSLVRNQCDTEEALVRDCWQK